MYVTAACTVQRRRWKCDALGLATIQRGDSEGGEGGVVVGEGAERGEGGERGERGEDTIEENIARAMRAARDMMEHLRSVVELRGSGSGTQRGSCYNAARLELGREEGGAYTHEGWAVELRCSRGRGSEKSWHIGQGNNLSMQRDGGGR